MLDEEGLSGLLRHSVLHPLQLLLQLQVQRQPDLGLSIQAVLSPVLGIAGLQGSLHLLLLQHSSLPPLLLLLESSLPVLLLLLLLLFLDSSLPPLLLLLLVRGMPLQVLEQLLPKLAVGMQHLLLLLLQVNRAHGIALRYWLGTPLLGHLL